MHLFHLKQKAFDVGWRAWRPGVRELASSTQAIGCMAGVGAFVAHGVRVQLLRARR
jgi:hypothetical protein